MLSFLTFPQATVAWLYNNMYKWNLAYAYTIWYYHQCMHEGCGSANSRSLCSSYIAMRRGFCTIVLDLNTLWMRTKSCGLTPACHQPLIWCSVMSQISMSCTVGSTTTWSQSGCSYWSRHIRQSGGDGIQCHCPGTVSSIMYTYCMVQVLMSLFCRISY